MYKVGYIDDEPLQYTNYSRKLKRSYPDMELVLLENCRTKQEFLEKIYQEQIDVLLIDYKMAGSYGFNGTTLLNYINDQMRDLECFILTAVEQDRITDGLVAERNRYSKTIFNTEGGDEEKVREFQGFISVLRESADVFRTRREQRVTQYQELLDKRKNGMLGCGEEEEFLCLYKVLASYGIIEKLPKNMLESTFDKALDELLCAGEAILKKYQEK